MIARTNIVAVVLLFVASIAFGQMKYSRPRSQQSATPTPSPTPQLSPTPAPNQRKTFAPATSGQSKPAPSVAMIPAQKVGTVPVQPRSAGPMPMIPSQKPGTVPIQSKQNPTQPQRTLAATVQPNQALTAAQRPGAAPMQPKFVATPAPIPSKPTPTPVPPPDVKAYLDKQLSKDQKFHMNVNGKDLALTPFHVWWQKSTGPDTTSTTVSMRSDEGRVYDIDFMTTGAQVTSIRISRINGEAVR